MIVQPSSLESWGYWQFVISLLSVAGIGQCLSNQRAKKTFVIMGQHVSIPSLGCSRHTPWGATPEGIVQSYDTLSLPDVYAVVSYYLSNPAPVDEYLRQCDVKADVLRHKIESSQAACENLRELIMARAKAKGLVRDQIGQEAGHSE